MTTPAAVVFTHRALGRMIRFEVGPETVFPLTFQEAAILARALRAVKDKTSPVLSEEIYMSPVAADGDFHGKVRPEGLALEGRDPPITLTWEQVGAAADALAAAAGDVGGH